MRFLIKQLFVVGKSISENQPILFGNYVISQALRNKRSQVAVSSPFALTPVATAAFVTSRTVWYFSPETYSNVSE